LEANERPPEGRGKALGDLGLADAGITLEQQRTLQLLHQPDRHQQLGIGDVAHLAQGG
jgi:hypothetical protein